MADSLPAKIGTPARTPDMKIRCRPHSHPVPGWRPLAAALTGMVAALCAGCSAQVELVGEPQSARAITDTVEDPLVLSVREILRADAELTQRIRIALLQDSNVGRFDINVVTLKGRASLIGVVDSRGQVNQAIRLASGIEGVRAVHDDLSVKSH